MPSETEEEIEMGTEDMELEDEGARRSEDIEEVLQLEGQEEEKGEDGDGNDKEKNTRKPMEPRSEIWQHFIMIKDENGVVKKGKCRYCSRLIKADTYINGTTAMKMHFNICKRNPHVNNKDPKQTTLATTKGEGITTWRHDPEVIREAFAQMVIEDELPFVTGEKRGFKKFISVACPRWSTPSRRMTTRDTV